MRSHVKRLKKTLELIESEKEFFALYDALLEHKSGLAHNRTQLLAAWKRGGELYTLQIKETRELFEDRDLRLELALFVSPGDPKPSAINLPVFCWRAEGDACIMLWTAPHLRKLGLATDIVRRLGINRAYDILPESRSFWNRLGISEVDKLPKRPKMPFVLEVVRFITDRDEWMEKRGKKEHAGYMRAHFRTKNDAALYYNRHNPHMRGLNAHGTWESDWDANTKLMYIVRQDRGLIQTIAPFAPQDEAVH